jgi:hypothetical protein
MADSSFWRDLADQFRALPLECKMLRADRHPVDDLTDELDHWELNGTATAKVLVDALARRAALEIQVPLSADLLNAWLEALIRHSGVTFHSQTILRGNNPDRTARPKRTIGTLYELPEHSANYCKMLESEALQAEAEEKRRNDPRNWSGLRQEFEAKRELKKLMAGPRETITETFAREAIARHSGITPEEVTPMQIRFEVAGLLREYPITYIPNGPASAPTESEKAPELDDNSAGLEPKQGMPANDSVEIERRRKLLAEYKAATGDSPDYRIYNANNSGIHKPEFYKWKKGILSAQSTTAANFERFLREKKPPISRDKS